MEEVALSGKKEKEIENRNHYTQAIKDLFTIWSWCFHFPNAIKYDVCRAQYILVRGSLPRKAMCFLWQFNLLIYLAWASGSEMFTSDNPFHRVTIRISNSIYVIYHLTLMYLWWNGGEKIVSILNEGMAILRKVRDLKGGGCKSFNVAIWMALLFNGVAGGIFSLMVTQAAIADWAVSDTGMLNHTRLSHDMRKISASCCSFYGDILCDGKAIEGAATIPLHAQIIFWVIVVQILTTEFFWSIPHIMISVWALFFGNILHGLLKRVGRGGLMNLKQGIALWNEVTVLINRWNETFGLIVFTTTFSFLVYKTLSISSFLRGEDHGWAMQWVNVLVYVPVTVGLFTSAELHRKIAKFPTTIKETFLMTGDHQINQVENLQGMQMIYYDILSGSVGFKGYRFFTISYLFIAQMVGVACTLVFFTVDFSRVHISPPLQTARNETI